MNFKQHIIVTGFGLSGCLLTRMLLKKEHPFLYITIIDEHFETEQKHLCFVRNKHIPQEFIKRSWDSISMRDNQGNLVVKKLEKEDYKLLDWEKFYNDTLNLCRNNDRVQIVKGRIKEIQEDASNVTVKVDDDRSFKADKVFNSVLLNKSKSDLMQQFKGAIVQFEEDVFDPNCIGLMDFTKYRQDGSIEFKYELPYSTKKALVEYTVIASSPLAKEVIDTRFNEMLENMGRTVGIDNVEYGVIPMPTSENSIKNTSKIFHIGLAGGYQRRSSGYLLQTVHDEVENWVKVLDNDLPIQRKKDKLKEYMDTVFLNVIKKNPSIGHKLFISMFKGTTGDEFLSFMFKSISWRSALPIIVSLPKTPFLKHAAIHFKCLL